MPSQRSRLALCLLLVVAVADVATFANRASRRAAKKKKKSASTIKAPGSTIPTPPNHPSEPTPTDRLSELFNSVLTLQDPRMWGALKQLPEMQQIADATRAAQSPLHGVGAFANTNLAVNTVASFYPVHSLGLGTMRLTAADAGDADYWKEPCTTAYRALVFHETGAGPIQEWAPGAYIDASPERSHVAGWLGHLANDAATVSADATEADITSYYASCARACNCVMLPFGTAAPVCALVTTRDVQAGDELLMSYGHTYWMEHFGGKAPTTPVVQRAAATSWGRDGLEAKVVRLAEKYAVEVQLLEGLLARGD